MPTSKPSHRYDIQKDGYDTWEIIDTVTGRTVVVDGKPWSGLKLDEADLLVDLMNSNGLAPYEVKR